MHARLPAAVAGDGRDPGQGGRPAAADPARPGYPAAGGRRHDLPDPAPRERDPVAFAELQLFLEHRRDPDVQVGDPRVEVRPNALPDLLRTGIGPPAVRAILVRPSTSPLRGTIGSSGRDGKLPLGGVAGGSATVPPNLASISVVDEVGLRETADRHGEVPQPGRGDGRYGVAAVVERPVDAPICPVPSCQSGAPAKPGAGAAGFALARAGARAYLEAVATGRTR